MVWPVGLVTVTRSTSWGGALHHMSRSPSAYSSKPKLRALLRASSKLVE